MGLPTDSAAQNRIHKMMLQALQYRRPKKYWVLKGFHGFRLKEFFETYPDATLVWLHRDPVQVAASSTAMMRDIMEGIVGPIDMVAEAKMDPRAGAHLSIGNTMTNPLIDDPRIHHVRYSYSVADPIGTIRGYYEFTGRRLTPQAGSGARATSPEQGGDRHGKSAYSTSLLTDAATTSRR